VRENLAFSLPKFNEDILNMSFLLSVFDNIVGPKVIHHWKTSLLTSTNGSNETNKQLENADLLKYIAIHTLNGELYQEKLASAQKFRLYLIKEVECAVFSVFFDANTTETSSYSNSGAGGGASGFDSYKYDDSSKSSSNKFGRKASSGVNSVQTTLNCFSVIVPLDKKDILLNTYGTNSSFFLNLFENLVLEYKVYAHIMPKVNSITKAVDFLTQSIKSMCNQMLILHNRGLSRYAQNTDEVKINVRLSLLKSVKFKAFQIKIFYFFEKG
jgi:hypothetical protein